MPPKKSAMTQEEVIQYLMLVFKHSLESKPNWQAIAQEGSINTANNAQRKFKRIVEQAGYALVKDAVVNVAGNTTVATTPTTTTPRTPRATTTPVTPAKKRKTEESNEDDSDDGQTPSKREKKE